MKLRKIASLFVVSTLAFSLVQTGTASATRIGDEGCTPGFWKNHTSVWEEYTPGTELGDVWTIPGSLASFQDVTFLTALDGGGGSGLSGAAKILFRAATAAYLNAASEGLGYPLRRFDDSVNGPAMQTTINAALASGSRAEMLAVAAYLDGLNNLGAELC